MTGGAVSESRIGHVVARRLNRDAVSLTSKTRRAVVALETDGVDHGPFQQLGIGGPMRRMTGLASVDANGGVFEEERSSQIRVALETGLFVAERVLGHARPRAHPPVRCLSTVRVVAVGALNYTFVHPVLERHIELRSYRTVAVVAQRRLCLSQEELLRF